MPADFAVQSRMKVAVYTIAKNEAWCAERWVNSVRDADYLVVGDTGSTDGLPELLEGLGVAVYRIHISPWRFEDARNAVLALVPADADVCVPLDMDEVMGEGWRAALEAAWTPQTTRLRYPFIWSHNADGTPAVRYYYDKIHARHGYRWRHPVHECLYPDRITEVQTWTDAVEKHHWPDDTKSRGQYLPLLELSVREDPQNARNAHYYGRELFFHGRHEEAERELLRHIALPTADWAAETCASWRYIAKCRTATGDLPGAEDALLNAVECASDLRDPWVDLAEVRYWREGWAGCLDAAKAALAIPHVPAAYMNDPRSFGATPHDLAAIACWNLGRFEEAAEHARNALALAPDDERLKRNLHAIEDSIQKAA